MKLLFKRLHPDAKLPTRANAGDAGFDLSSVEEYHIPAGGRELINTGLSVAIPEGHYGRIAPRSGLAVKSGVSVLGGVVDSSYRGEVKVVLASADAVFIKAGDRVAQLILERISTPEAEWADELPETARGVGSFGSSGR